MMNTYFASDGSYGDAEGLAVLPVEKWGHLEWSLIEYATDSERLVMALQIDTWLYTEKRFITVDSLLWEALDRIAPEELDRYYKD